MKYIKSILISLTLALSLASCSSSLSTEALTEEVIKSMREKMEPIGISIQSLILTKKGGNVYAGVLETIEDTDAFTYTVEVIYDGTNMTWEVLN
ncbi:hypothetical protein OAK04_02850 [Verrucomicrobia bacterium]|nr:hypothetical protein [Verrucomicrobiota bacterium]